MLQMMRAYCEEAVKYGDTPAIIGQPRKITVVLNPAANKRSGFSNVYINVCCLSAKSNLKNDSNYTQFFKSLAELVDKQKATCI